MNNYVYMLKPLKNNSWGEIKIPVLEKDYYLKQGWKLKEETRPAFTKKSDKKED